MVQGSRPNRKLKKFRTSKKSCNGGGIRTSGYISSDRYRGSVGLRTSALPDYLKPPPGMRSPLWPIQKCLYGHPLSGHLWIGCFKQYLIEHNWTELSESLFTRDGCMLCVYVDDFLAHGRTFREHLANLEKVFGRLESTGLARIGKIAVVRSR